MKHAPASAVALFFDEIRFEATNKTSWMGNYAGGLTLLDPENLPVDRLALVVLAHWRYGTEPGSIRIVVETPSGPIEQLITVRSEGQLPPQEESPFAGLRLMVPMNLRVPPLAPGQNIDAWLVVEAEPGEAEERYALGRLTISAAAQAQPAPQQPKRRSRSRKAQADVP